VPCTTTARRDALFLSLHHRRVWKLSLVLLPRRSPRDASMSVNELSSWECDRIRIAMMSHAASSAYLASRLCPLVWSTHRCSDNKGECENAVTVRLLFAPRPLPLTCPSCTCVQSDARKEFFSKLTASHLIPRQGRPEELTGSLFSLRQHSCPYFLITQNCFCSLACSRNSFCRRKWIRHRNDHRCRWWLAAA